MNDDNRLNSSAPEPPPEVKERDGREPGWGAGKSTDRGAPDAATDEPPEELKEKDRFADVAADEPPERVKERDR
jgi:hypothetical protein